MGDNLRVIWHDGREYGTAREIAAALGDDVTVGMVRNWASRDGLPRHRVGVAAYYPLHRAAKIERNKRLAGRGRPRQLDITALVP